MESEFIGVGCMVVIAVIGRNGKCGVKRRVRFAENVIEPSSNNKEYRKKNHQAHVIGDHHASSMPLNKQVFQKTITKTHHISN
ncbi:hypothetical protein PVK06_011595 [Gossypium arboreum]|uniref:Uncharacterized protein n=1 Tax=Gossypium arboreum TaxID=29729 RepID=A0ABR0QA47_GOSAR|nr:hypothetical protein PVK06_011595 [Gossypium arboreum]